MPNVAMIWSRFKSVTLVAIGVIIGSSVVLLLHWASRQPQGPVANIKLNVVDGLSAGSVVYDNASLRMPPNMNATFNTVPAKFTTTLTELTLAPTLPKAATCHGKSFTPSISNVFLYHAVCNISKSKDIAQFSGSSMASLFDVKRSQLHYTINQKLSAWSAVAHDLNQTRLQGLNQSIHEAAVHMHNYHKLGDFMLLFWTEYFRFGPSGRSLKKGGKGLPLTSEQFNWAIEKNQPPVVITNWGDENWGHLSGREY